MNIRKDLKVFNDIIICFCENFYQIFSIIKNVELERIIRFTLRISYLWNHIQVLRLTKNMRLRNSNLIEQNRVDIKKFAKNLLNMSNEISSNIKKRNVIDWFINQLLNNSIIDFINVIYRDLDSHRRFDFYIFKAILCTLNKNIVRFNN